MTQRILEEAKQRLREVEDGIATMQTKYRECITKKEELELKCEQCEQRLGRADKVLTSLPVGWACGLGWPGSGGGVGPVRPPQPLGLANHHPSHGAAPAAHQWAVRREGTVAGNSGEPGVYT